MQSGLRARVLAAHGPAWGPSGKLQSKDLAGERRAPWRNLIRRTAARSSRRHGRSWSGRRGSASIFWRRARWSCWPDAYYGFGSNPDSFALGFRIDPILAALNLVWGLVGTFIGFFRPSYATAFVLAFAAFYTVLAVLGSFTPHHFGMLLNARVNLFHWVIVAIAWAVGLYALWHKSRPR